jgi:hypothetical protein
LTSKDKTARTKFQSLNTTKRQSYDAQEKAQLMAGLQMETRVSGSEDLIPLKSRSPLLVSAHSAVWSDGRKHIVQSSAIIRADIASVVAYMMVPDQEHLKLLADEELLSVNATKVLLRKNDHSHVFHWTMNLPVPLMNRAGVFMSVYQKLSHVEHIISQESTEYQAGAGVRPLQKSSAVRFKGKRLFRFSEMSPTATRFIATSMLDLGGAIPR